jgi:RNA polymerase sigma-70 factor, ECF subfamily
MWVSEMNDAAGHLPGILVTQDLALEREFEQAVRESGELAVRVAFGVLRQRQDAEEVAQEAFARAYRRFAGLRERQQFRAWIVRVTWRLAIDRWRGDRRRQVREQTAAEHAGAANVEDLAAEAERSALLWKAIDALPEKLRIVVVLSALQEHDVREVARLLDIPEGTVKSRLFLARKELARSLTCLANDSSTR